MYTTLNSLGNLGVPYCAIIVFMLRARYSLINRKQVDWIAGPVYLHTTYISATRHAEFVDYHQMIATFKNSKAAWNDYGDGDVFDRSSSGFNIVDSTRQSYKNACY